MAIQKSSSWVWGIGWGVAALLFGAWLGFLFSPQTPAVNTAKDLSDHTLRQRAAMITSTFENSTTEIQYNYFENIGDERGITAGRAGFTSRNGDLLQVLEYYNQLKPDNPTAAFIPALKKVKNSTSTNGLEELQPAWQAASDDALFRQAQDEVADELYFRPAYEMAKKYGISTALGQAMIWDNCILTGCDYTGDSTGATLEAVKVKRGIATVETEVAWLRAFLDEALATMLTFDEDGTLDDEPSRSRITAWRSLLHAKKLSLDPPLQWQVYGDTCSIDSSGKGLGSCR